MTENKIKNEKQREIIACQYEFEYQAKEYGIES